MKKLTVVSSDYDYSPVVIHLEGEGVIFEGDSGHDSGYNDYATGFKHAYGILGEKLERINISIYDEETLLENKEFLESIRMYSEYEEVINEGDNW